MGLVVLLALVPAVWSALKKTPEYQVGISYGAGPIEGRHFQEIVQPGSNLFFNGFFDPLYLYPADQRVYLAAGASDAGDARTGPIGAPSKDQVQVRYQVATYFRLNTDRLQGFHEFLGRKYSAYTDEGWKQMLEENFRPQLQNALQEQTRLYGVAALYSNSDLLVRIQEQVQRQLTRSLEAALGDQYFCGPQFEPRGRCPDLTVAIQDINIPERVRNAFEQRRTQRIEIEQRKAESESIRAFSGALDEAGRDYVLLRAIESGNVDFWVLPNESDLTLQAPSGDGTGAPGSESGGNDGGPGLDGGGGLSPDGGGGASPDGSGAASPNGDVSSGTAPGS